MRTYAVGYGTDVSLNQTLPCIAASGGTFDAIYPRDPSELVSAFEQIFDASRQP